MKMCILLDAYIVSSSPVVKFRKGGLYMKLGSACRHPARTIHRSMHIEPHLESINCGSPTEL